jgi:hypothetical protein
LWARYGSLSAAALAFIGAAIEEGDSKLGPALATVGLILIGVWITLETHFLLSDTTESEKGNDDAPAD